MFFVHISQAVVNNLEDAHEQIDTAISTAIKESKPVYISISCNLPSIPHPTFSRHPVPFFLSPRYISPRQSDEQFGIAHADKPVHFAGYQTR
jgi:TPP-dependent 2-oxoacid decarboxylase